MRYAIDTFAIVRGCIVVTGWTDGRLPSLYLGKTKLATCAARSPRSDLVTLFGERARSWGFRLAAATEEPTVPDGNLSLRWPGGRVTGPRDAAALPQGRRSMWELLDQFRARVAAAPGPLLEIGSRARSGHSYRGLFPPTIDYRGLDVKEGPNVDVVGDAHHLSRHVEGPFDYVFSVSVFEHLLMPWKVALEMNAVMPVGGLAYIQSHPMWPLHEEPWDFWRFSENGWRGLFSSHTGFSVIGTGYDIQAMTVPVFAGGGSTVDIEHEQAFLATACLVEKTGPARVAWDAEAGDAYDLAYSHA
ncbi:class I SAM-dependent methyltransferase [Methylobacterium brachythecii]|uniref:Methyltransferase type 11 n=1 Tax=Methylobacterium brachythecii TaxID=1176177 RepID=A0A7W6F7F0_9HYPH|nr:class I SAM-dependent methyltransferase [Methylobacterium brachythecii]MBB3903021.1 hypothetical protein [Methylobacterium brachythecii]GLS45742.1 hypothetical protein GCM10007884_37330 [Methylobacterium brachythecii]